MLAYSMEIMSILPDDVVEEILMRLSVKHLMQLKCVCKHWYALIRDYGFHKKHYHFQYARLDVIPLCLCELACYSDPDQFTKYYLLSRHEGVDVVLNLTDDLKRDITPAITNDPELPTLHLDCMGIVNGVVGLQWLSSNFPKHLALWNPATRDFKSLSSWPIVLDNEATKGMGARILGFGFDPHSDDFKILVMNTFYVNDDNDAIKECHLYSLKANSWKRLQEAPSSFLIVMNSSVETYLNNGFYYWCAWGNNLERVVILSFKFSTGIFKEFELPEAANISQYMRTVRVERTVGVQLGKYKECLALYVTHSLKNTDINFEIWAATKFHDDDHGVPSSWQLVLIVGPIRSFNGLSVKRVRVCGDLLLMIQRGNSEEEELGCLYDPSTCTFNFLEVGFSTCFSYVESLFSLSQII